MLDHDRPRVLASEDPFARGQHPRDAAERVEVGPRPLLADLLPDLLGRHIARRAGLASVDIELQLAGQRGQPEVDQLHAREAPVDEHDIAELQVPVNDVSGVGVGEHVEDRQEELAQLVPRVGR